MTEGKCHICRNVLTQGSYYDILFVRVMQALFMSHSVFKVWPARALLQSRMIFLFCWYHCNSMQSSCNSVGREADVERALPAHQLVTLELKSCISDSPASYLTFCLFNFELMNSEFGVALWPWGRRSCCCPSQSSENHLDRNWELNTD